MKVLQKLLNKINSKTRLTIGFHDNDIDKIVILNLMRMMLKDVIIKTIKRNPESAKIHWDNNRIEAEANMICDELLCADQHSTTKIEVDFCLRDALNGDKTIYECVEKISDLFAKKRATETVIRALSQQNISKSRIID